MKESAYWNKMNRMDCKNKRSFPSFRLASEFNNRQQGRNGVFAAKGKKIEKLHVYKCTNCGEYHIGHALRHQTRKRFRPLPRYERKQHRQVDFRTEE